MSYRASNQRGVLPSRPHDLPHATHLPAQFRCHLMTGIFSLISNHGEQRPGSSMHPKWKPKFLYLKMKSTNKAKANNKALAELICILRDRLVKVSHTCHSKVECTINSPCVASQLLLTPASDGSFLEEKDHNNRYRTRRVRCQLLACCKPQCRPLDWTKTNVYFFGTFK